MRHLSTTNADYSAAGLTDGVVDGFPGNTKREWCTKGERNTATVRLTWDSEQSIDRIWLFDRRNELDQIKSGMLFFSDGTSIKVGELPDNSSKGVEVKFPAKRVQWVIFAVNEVKPSTQNIGLAEIAVFRSH